MNIQNKSSIYAIYDAAPPSYAEATGSSTSSPYNPEFNQRCSHSVIHPLPSAPFSHPLNYYVNNSSVQPIYPEYESAERQNQPTSIPYNTAIITTTEGRTCVRIFQFIWVACTMAIVVGMLVLLIRASQ